MIKEPKIKRERSSSDPKLLTPSRIFLSLFQIFSPDSDPLEKSKMSTTTDGGKVMVN